MSARKFSEAVSVGAGATIKKVPSLPRVDLNWCEKKKRSYARSFQLIQEVDLENDKMTVLEPELQARLATASGAKVCANGWTVPSKVTVSTTTQFRYQREESAVEYRCGGLAALLKALETLHNDPSARVVFSTDGQLSIMDRSGLQGHEHPTQFDEYSFWDLFEAMGDNVWDHREAEASDYRSFTIPLDFTEIDTLRALPQYMSFFLEFARHKVMSIGDVTELSKGVVRKQKHSLAMYSRIDEMTRKALGKGIMHRHGRMYFAFGSDLRKLEKGLKTWQALGIESYMVEKEFMEKRTTFDLRNEELFGYYIPNDGYFTADIMETLVAYLEKTYPERFTFRGKTRLQEVLVDPESGAAVAVREKMNGGMEEVVTRVSSVYASLGHDQIFDRRGKSKEGQVYKEILATSSTGDWVQVLNKEELAQRCPQGMTIEEFLDPSNLLPVADKYNLHVTPLWVEDQGSAIHVYHRVTEGGVVSYEAPRSKVNGQGVTDRRDLINTLYKVNRSNIGTWRPLSIGSCSRKIDQTNSRKELDIASNVTFSYNASGTGVVDAAGKISLA